MATDTPEVLPNRTFPLTVLIWGVWLFILWIATAGVLELRFGESPFLLWSNVPSRVLTTLGLAWFLFCAPFFAWIVGLVNSPRELLVGPDFIEGSPPHRSGIPPSRRTVHIRFEVISRIGWTALGPGVMGGREAGPGSFLLVSIKNLHLLHQRWAQWKMTAHQSPLSGLPPY